MLSSNQKYRVAIVDDHPIFTDGLKLALKNFDNIEDIGVFFSTREFLEDAKENCPDIIFMDIKFKYEAMDGIEATKEICKINPNVKVVAVSMYDDGNNIQAMFEAGACGYITKDNISGILKDVFDRILNNEIYMSVATASNLKQGIMNVKKKLSESSIYTIRNAISEKDFSELEMKIIRLTNTGKTDKEIDSILNVGKKKIEYRKGEIYKKLGVKKSAAMISKAYEVGLLP